VDVVGAALGSVTGLALFWLFPLKLISRLAARLGYRSPCPAAVSWLVDNRIRKCYMRPIADRIGIRPGERVLELGPGPGAFTVDAGIDAHAECGNRSSHNEQEDVS